MTASDNETPAAQVAGWIGEGHATWGAVIGGVWTEFPLYPTNVHGMASVMERHLPERAA